jgi:hypothetical protein
MTPRRRDTSEASGVDLIGTGTFPSGPNRMTEAGVRLRALAAIVILVAMSWGAIALLGNTGCPGFSTDETRAIASLPVTPSCIQATIAPTSPVDQLPNELNQITSPTPGVQGP